MHPTIWKITKIMLADINKSIASIAINSQIQNGKFYLYCDIGTECIHDVRKKNKKINIAF